MNREQTDGGRTRLSTRNIQALERLSWRLTPQNWILIFYPFSSKILPFFKSILMSSRKRIRMEQDLKWSISSSLLSHFLLFSDLFLCSLLFLSGQFSVYHSVSLDVFIFISWTCLLTFLLLLLIPPKCVSRHLTFVSSKWLMSPLEHVADFWEWFISWKEGL